MMGDLRIKLTSIIKFKIGSYNFDLFPQILSLIYCIYRMGKTFNKRGMVMMENLTHVENWNLKKKAKIGWN